MTSRRFSRRTFLKTTATLAAANAIGVPEIAWREAWGAPATAGGTTVSRTIVGTGGLYQKLAYGPGEPYLLREDLGATAQTGRAQRRIPLLYFAQLSDTHIVDAQSPARVEYVDIVPGGGAAFRPHDMLTPHVLDAMVRQINSLQVSELSGASLAFAINTGDVTDNRQYNELRWVIDMLDGGNITLKSGGTAYEGVQKGNSFYYYYHPDQPLLDSFGRQYNFPAYPGLLESAELAITAEGLRVPWYTALGNHDGLVQGNVPSLPLFERIATGRIKIMGFPFEPEQRTQFTRELLRGNPTPWKQLLDWANTHSDAPAVKMVTPDANRRLVSHQEWISEHFTTHGLPVGHGFTSQNVETDTGYYTFDPSPGVHCVVLDTVNPAGGADGNLDKTQFDWLNADLAAHTGTTTIVIAHHTIATMDNTLLRPGDPNPPYSGQDLMQLLWSYPNVVAFVNGHTHWNGVIAHPNPLSPGAGFWEINTAAHNDWPQQSRLIELFDNADGTLSIFGTVVDHQADPSSTSLSPLGMATISRELSFNDPQWGHYINTGTPLDRNVELIISRAGAPRRR